MSVLMWIVNQVITFQIKQYMNFFSGAEDFFFFKGGGGHGSNYFNPVMKHSLKVFMQIINSFLFKLFNATTLGLKAKFPLFTSQGKSQVQSLIKVIEKNKALYKYKFPLAWV